MKKSALIVMVDVMVLSVLSMQVGDGDSRFPIPIHRWAQLIERGIEKEADYRSRIAELEAAIEATRDSARRAELQAMLSAEQERVAQERAERMEHERLEAERRAAEAQELARLAEIASERRDAEREQIAREAEEARERREQALAQAVEAERQAAAARERAELAQREAQDRLEEIAAIRIREAESLQAAERAEGRAREAESLMRMLETRMDETRSDFEIAVAQEREYAERMAQALASEAEIRGRAEVFETELRGSQDLLERKSTDIAEMSGRIVGLQAAEEFARKDLERVEVEKTQLAESLEMVEQERQESVWVRRDRSMRRLGVYMLQENPRSADDVKEEELFLPLVMFGDQPALVSEFHALQMDWWEIQVNRNLSRLLYTLHPLEESDDAPPTMRTLSMIYSDDEPRILYLPFEYRGDDVEPLQPIGIDGLKSERIQRAVLFKADDPDENTEVKITPLMRDNYVRVESTGPRSLRIRRGDYILTERGRFVGVMVSSDLCFVPSPELPPREKRRTIPLIKTPNQEYFDPFVEGARSLRQKIRSIERESRSWFLF